MAVDQAILESAAAGSSPPTLRLYAWDPVCLSIGYAQPVADVDRAKVAGEGWSLVRRPSGGTAVLHREELSFAMAAPESHPVAAGGVLALYRRLSGPLVLALRLMGLEAQAEPGATSRGREPICFLIAAPYEITVNGKKLVGSAQRRRRGGVLQHGTIPLAGDLTPICRMIRYRDDAARAEAEGRLRALMTTVELASGRRVGWEEMASALAEALARELDVRLEPGNLTLEERRRAEQLRRDRYARQEWTLQR
jgi:lipoate-protein ligase A